jgi:antitoxin (DNA-binding transcriptional repressor) of toxin-antitoxin stability system
MKTIGIYEAKTKFSALIKDVAMGERIVITHRGEAVAEIRRPEGAGEDAVDSLLHNEIPLGISIREAIEAGRR